MRARLLALALLAACSTTAEGPPRVNDSGGALSPEQAAYDVLEYDLAVAVDPERRSIDGALTVRARALAPLEQLVLDLDQRLDVEEVRQRGASVGFAHYAGQLRVALLEPAAPGDGIEVTVRYAGAPREAPRPPWEGGFTWSETADGSPWIATSNQGEGADLWWPCKDHPSDEPDSMRIAVTVPAPLVCASNGRLEGVDENPDGTRTFRWHVTTPISNYTVALNIAPYVAIEREYQSVAGDSFPVTYWVLPEHREQGEALMEQILAHLRFFEERFGPYPFRADKYGVVETPHLGMEHQTIIAYGNQYRDNEWGYDWLHHHELAHEWWANLVTAPDWNDFWIHEGFGTYAQNLYVEELHGADAYRRSMAAIRPRILNRRAVAPREPRTSGEMYFLDLDVPPGQRQSDSDIYFKGAWVLHTLRWLLGDETFAHALRRMAYPDPALEATRDGSACRFATTDGIQAIAERISGRELGWFFELYLRQPELPRLAAEQSGDALRLRWITPQDLPFPMPVEVRVGEELVRVEMPGGVGALSLPEGAEVELDPRGWLLRAE